MAGSALLPESSMTLLLLNIVAVLALPSSHYWTHSRPHLQPGFSLYVLLFLSSPSTRPLSECYCFADSGFRCRLPQHAAVANARWMCWVIMSQLAPGPAPYVSKAGAAVATNVLVRDLNLQTARPDERRIEVIANGLPLWGGSQLAVDTTRVSPVTSAGAPRHRGGATAGAALADARRSKERTYPEFGRASRCRLVVLGIEVGGRWSAEAASFVRLLARARARTALPLQRAATIAAFVGRWSGLLSVAAARSFAASLLSLPISNTANVDGEPPLLSGVLADSAESPPLASRLA